MVKGVWVETFPFLLPKHTQQIFLTFSAMARLQVCSLWVSGTLESKVSNTALLCKSSLFPAGKPCAWWSPFYQQKLSSCLLRAWCLYSMEPPEQTEICIFVSHSTHFLPWVFFFSSFFASLWHSAHRAQASVFRSALFLQTPALGGSAAESHSLFFLHLGITIRPLSVLPGFQEDIFRVFKRSRLQAATFNISRIIIDLSAFVLPERLYGPCVPFLPSSPPSSHNLWPLYGVFITSETP